MADHASDGVCIVDNRCYGFDSFEGLPEDWRPGFAEGHFQVTDGRLPTFAPEVVEHLELVVGWFEDTLPTFLAEHPEPVALLHLDSDVYTSAVFVLRQLVEHERILEGTVIVFDELFNYCGFESHEMLALFEVASPCKLTFRWLGVRQKGCMQAALVVTGIGAAPAKWYE